MVVIIALDPSGNFAEGNGTTGVCKLEENSFYVTELTAKHYSSAEEYWKAHTNLLDTLLQLHDIEVVMEGYRLYGHKSDTQVNSTLETPQLIGVIKYWCYVNKVPLKIQFASEVKSRWADKILINTGIIELVNTRRKLISSGQWLNNHKTDALRHALHYQKYGRKT